MGALQNYIDGLKKKIAQKEPMSEIEIIRYIYIDLGRKMNFDLKYTFGNSKQKSHIYNMALTDEKIDELFEKRTIICKSLAYILKRILTEFGIDCSVAKYQPYAQRNAHIYNTIKLKDGREAIFDLEGDLEYIQTGSKTRYFGVIMDRNNLDGEQNLVSPKELKEIDKTTAEYIPWKFYVEDVLPILKFGLKSMQLEEKLRNLLDNLDVYVRDVTIAYRDRIYYHNRMLQETMKPEELNKINQIDCYRIVDGEKKFVSCVVLNRGTKDKLIFLYSDKTGRYEEITLQDLVLEIKEGLVLTKSIQGLRKYLKPETTSLEKDRKDKAIDSTSIEQ